MKNAKVRGSWRILILGALLGGLGATLIFKPAGLSAKNWRDELRQGLRLRPVIRKTPWPPPEYNEACSWVYLKVDESGGWTTGPIGTFKELSERIDAKPSNELVAPIFPSVFTPVMMDKLYYDALLSSDIKEGDKVLVIGAGSGADSWVASLKSRSTVYAIDINPMAIVNAKTTAMLGDFPLVAAVGDIRNLELPDAFCDFDFVLWNMPFLEGAGLRRQNFHDGDNGNILEGLLQRLPALLKPTGRAILLNVKAAEEFIDFPGVSTSTDGRVVLFDVPCSSLDYHGQMQAE